MANVATALNPIPFALAPGQGLVCEVTPVVCTFDTTASALTVFTPTLATHYGAIVGILYEEADAHDLTLTAGSTALVTLQRAANEGLCVTPGSGGPLIIGQPGEALKITCGTAAVATMLVFCTEQEKFMFTNR